MSGTWSLQTYGRRSAQDKSDYGTDHSTTNCRVSDAWPRSRKHLLSTRTVASIHSASCGKQSWEKTCDVSTLDLPVIRPLHCINHKLNSVCCHKDSTLGVSTNEINTWDKEHTQSCSSSWRRHGNGASIHSTNTIMSNVGTLFSFQLFRRTNVLVGLSTLSETFIFGLDYSSIWQDLSSNYIRTLRCWWQEED